MGAMIRKEFAQLRRDHRTAAMLVVVPLLLLVVFGYAARFEVEAARTAVIGPSASAVADALPAVLDVRLVEPETTDGDALLRREDVDAVLDTATGTLRLDGTQLFAARAVRQAFAATPAGGPGGGPLAVEVAFNPDLSTPTIMVPALVGLIMLFIGCLATSLGVVRERQTGTLEQLAVMPLSPTDLFVGKLAPYLAIAVLDLLVIVGVGLTLFDVPFRGSVLLFAVGAAIFLFVALSLGVLISTVSENQGQAVQLALMVLLPQVMLSGLLFPIEAMAGPLRIIARALPLTWFNQVARGVMIRGATLSEVAVPLGVLCGMAVVIFGLAVRRFARDLAPAPVKAAPANVAGVAA